MHSYNTEKNLASYMIVPVSNFHNLKNLVQNLFMTACVHKSWWLVSVSMTALVMEKLYIAESLGSVTMSQQGAALQTYNNELVKSLEELKTRRAALQVQKMGVIP